MKLKAGIIIIMILLENFAFGQKQKLQKIIILEENNPVLNFNYKNLDLPDSINTTVFSNLKKYVLSKTTITTKEEPEIYFELMKWVSNQWKHNGWNSAPDSLNSLEILKSVHDEGLEYRCVEYGIVLNDILKSFGFPARTVGLKHIDTDYGGAGMGHVAIEVWSNKFNKWIFLDPQFGIYAEKNNIPLNIFEIYQIKSQGNFKQIEFIDVTKNKKNKKYGKKFLSKYLGYINIFQKRNKLDYTLALKMEGKRNFLTFQSFPSRKMIFTKNVSDVYFSLNQTMVIIDYNEKEIERSKNKYSKLNIKNIADFNKNMSLFSAKPEFELLFDNNMPWFKSYKVKLNGSIIEKNNEKYLVSLKKGINTIEVVAINQNKIKGIPTIIKIKYE